MDALTIGGIAAVLGVCTSVTGLASFYFGRRKAATEAAKEDTKMSLDLQYIKDTVRDTTKAIDKLVAKMESQNDAREKQYRDLLVEFTKLESSYSALHSRMDRLAEELDRIRNS